MTYSVSNLNATEELGAFLLTNSNILLHKSSNVNDKKSTFLEIFNFSSIMSFKFFIIW